MAMIADSGEMSCFRNKPLNTIDTINDIYTHIYSMYFEGVKTLEETTANEPQ